MGTAVFLLGSGVGGGITAKAFVAVLQVEWRYRAVARLVALVNVTFISEAFWVLPTLFIIKSKIPHAKIRHSISTITQWQANNRFSKGVILVVVPWKG